VTIDRLLLLASLLAAVAAAYYARGAVTDARAFHHEQERDIARERLHKVVDTLADLAPVAHTVGMGGAAEFGLLRAMLARFRATVATTAEPLPVCRALAGYDLDGSHLGDPHPWQPRGRDIERESGGAFAELTAAIEHLRDSLDAAM
jgi:hypothetical protein